jgi:hypothetical protein
MRYRRIASIVMAAWCSAALAQFVPDDQVVSDAASDLPQPEFDVGTSRIIWQEDDVLWVGSIDPVSGALNPTDGKGTQVDTGVAPIGQVGNTPRYSHGLDASGNDESAIVYTKTASNGGNSTLRLAKAVEDGPNDWTVIPLTGWNRWKANGTTEGNTGRARIVYNLGQNCVPAPPQCAAVAPAWRIIDDTEEHIGTGYIGAGGRFLGSEPALVLLRRVSGVAQAFEVGVDGVVHGQITNGAHNKANPFPWFAPEANVNNYALVVMVDTDDGTALKFTRLKFYNRTGQGWDSYYTIDVSSPKFRPSGIAHNYFSSPEAFVVDGISYVAVAICAQLGGPQFPGQCTGDSEIWLLGIPPNDTFVRRIDDPGYAAPRTEPEPFTLQDGTPVVYYTELDDATGNHLVKRASTGL